MIEIRVLLPGDDRSSFSSGEESLDRYFRRYAGQNQFRHRIGTNYIAISDGRIAGYTTVSAAHIEAEKLPAAIARRLPAYPLPVLRLARLATASVDRGRGIGEALLRYVLLLARQMSREYGCVGVVADAKLGAEAFYARYGFQALEVTDETEGQIPMFLPLGGIPE